MYITFLILNSKNAAKSVMGDGMSCQKEPIIISAQNANSTG